MYNKLKIILGMITILFVASLGFLFIKNNQNEMFSGYNEVISVENSNIDFNEQLEKIVKENKIVIAKRIVTSKDNFNGKLENTYIPIGSNSLPDNLPLQKNKKIIKNSPSNTLYIITNGKLTAQNLADQLNSQNNKVEVFSTDYKFVILRLMFSIPQTFMIAFVLFIAFSSLILAEYISNIKTMGIRRLSGEGKHSIALKSAYKDSKILLSYSFLISIALLLLLLIYNLFSIKGFLIIIVPMCLWLFILLGANFFLSNIFYYILQNQPLNLSIKGKAPVNSIFLIVLVTQMLTLFSLMYSVKGLTDINHDLSILNKGQQEWSKYTNFFQMSSIDDGGTVSKKEKKLFYEELISMVDMIMVNSNLDDIEIFNQSQENNYDPYNQQIPNVIYVNENFIKHSNITFSKNTLSLISKLKPFENLILIPKTKENDFESLKIAWSELILQDAKSAIQDTNSSISNPKIFTDIYDDSEEVFVYPIFNEGGQLYSNNSFVKSPIIIVGTLYSNLQMYPDAWNIRVTDPDVVSKFIKEKELNHALGSLTNGFYSINERINLTRSKKSLLLISTGVSILSSILLLILLNAVYFYQGRKKFFIERLAGKSYLSIHKIYLNAVLFCNVIIILICAFLSSNRYIIMTPIFYMLLILLVFFIQLKKEKRGNVLVMKGE